MSKKYRIAVIPGDGIGLDVTKVGLKILQKLAGKHDFDYETKVFPFGGRSLC